MYTSQDIEKLFLSASIFVINNDVVPVKRAEKIFGKDAVKFASEAQNGLHYNGYGIGDYTMMYLTKKGFCIAATYCNVREYESEEKAL